MRQLIDRTINALDVTLKGRDDTFMTTSFGYQSALLFYMLTEIDQKPKCLYVSSDLASGGVDEHARYLQETFDIDLRVVDRQHWLEEKLNGRSFIDLTESERRSICRELKRKPLKEFIDANTFKIWISGIRKDQSNLRKNVQYIEKTDLNVVKVSPLYSWTASEVRDFLQYTNLRPNTEYYDLCKENAFKECGLHY